MCRSAVAQVDCIERSGVAKTDMEITVASAAAAVRHGIRARAGQADGVSRRTAGCTIDENSVIAVAVRRDAAATARSRDQVVAVSAHADRGQPRAHRNIVLAGTDRNAAGAIAGGNVGVKSRNAIGVGRAVANVDRIDAGRAAQQDGVVVVARAAVGITHRVAAGTCEADGVAVSAVGHAVNVHRIVAIAVRRDRAATSGRRDQVVAVATHADCGCAQPHRNMVLASTHRNTAGTRARRDTRIKQRNPVGQGRAVAQHDGIAAGGIAERDNIIVITACNGRSPGTADPDGIGIRAAAGSVERNRIGTSAGAAGPGHDRAATATGGDGVVTRAQRNIHVLATAYHNDVVAIAGRYRIIAAIAQRNGIVAIAQSDLGAAVAGIDRVVTITGGNIVGAISIVDLVVAIAQRNGVGIAATVNNIVAVASQNDIWLVQRRQHIDFLRVAAVVIHQRRVSYLAGAGDVHELELERLGRIERHLVGRRARNIHLQIERTGGRGRIHQGESPVADHVAGRQGPGPVALERRALDGHARGHPRDDDRVQGREIASHVQGELLGVIRRVAGRRVGVAHQRTFGINDHIAGRGRSVDRGGRELQGIARTNHGRCVRPHRATTAVIHRNARRAGVHGRADHVAHEQRHHRRKADRCRHPGRRGRRHRRRIENMWRLVLVVGLVQVVLDVLDVLRELLDRPHRVGIEGRHSLLVEIVGVLLLLRRIGL